MIHKTKLFAVLVCSSIIVFFLAENSSAQTIIQVDPSTTHQTITGWEVASYALDWPGHSAAFPMFLDEVLDRAVNEIGINRVRLGIGCGVENPVDYGGQFINGQITEYEYIHIHSGQIVNDNPDPNTINPNGFHFTFFDRTVDNIVVPLRKRLDARGEKLFVNLCYVDFASSSFEHYNYPEEYAEFVLATYQHLQTKYGWVPDAWEVILEPDNSAWTGTHIGNCVVAAANRLKANGFTPNFIVPSTTNMANAITYFDSLAKVPGALQYVSELSYHRYSGVSDANLQAIASRALQNGINTAMLEHLGSSYINLHKDLTIGRNSAWSGAYSLAGKNPNLDLYVIDDADPLNPIVSITNHGKFYRQYFEFVRSGAVRIQATTSNTNFDPLAFLNQNGRFVVVVKADTSGSFIIQGLPSGTYGIKYTTASQYDVDLSNQTIHDGENLITSIPAVGVLTVYSKSTDAPPEAPTALRIIEVKK